MPLIPGYRLTDDQRQQILDTFTERLTLENRHAYAALTGRCLRCREPWSACLGACMPLQPDVEWIKARAFHFTRSESLAKQKPCYTMAEYAIRGGEISVRPAQDRRQKQKTQP